MRTNFQNRSMGHFLALAFVVFTPLFASGQAAQPAQVADHFAGNWVEDLSQRKTGGERNLTFRNGPKGLEEVRGSYSRPLVESVRFGAGPYTFGEPNATMEWQQQGNGQFERKMMDNGKLLETREITVSPDGKTLTEKTARILADGKTEVTTIVYARVSGSGQTLQGVWKPQSVKSDTPFQMSVQCDGSILKVATGSGMNFALALDGKPAPITGPGLISGTTASAKVVGAREIQVANARMGTPTDIETWRLSADGKSLTITMKPLGKDATKEPSVFVYTKQ